MPRLNLYTGKTQLSFDDLLAIARVYEAVKLEVLPDSPRHKALERGLELIRDYWLDRKMETSPYDGVCGTDDPIRWLNT